MNPDLRNFLELLDERGSQDLVRLERAADPHYELTALALELLSTRLELTFTILKVT